jgi:hypothetical protein
MMRRIFLIIVFAFATGVAAQSDTASRIQVLKKGIRYKVTTVNDITYEGFVASQDSEFVVIEDRLADERWELRKKAIVRVERPGVREIVLDALGDNPHGESYVLLSSAFPFRKHSVSTTGHWFLLGSSEYALHRNWAVTANSIGFMPVTLGIRSVFRLTKLNHIGFGTFIAGSIQDRLGLFFLGYGGSARFTHGNSNRNLTLLAGVAGLSSDLFPRLATPGYVNMTYLGGAYCNRFRKYAAFNIEGWYLPDNGLGIAGGAFKLFQDEHTCWTLGCFAFFNNSFTGLRFQTTTLPVPYFGIKRRF